MTKRRPSRTTANQTQRATVTGISGAVIILIVLIAQFVFGVDVLNTKEDEDKKTDEPIVEPGNNVPPGDIIAIPGGYDGGWFQLYFTQPINSEDEADFHGAPIEAALVTLLDGAQQTIDAALYELNSRPVTDALIRAHERGVQVRIVTDGEHGLEDPEATLTDLELAGIPVESDGTDDDYMHDKFFVVDSTYVWTGSTNITHNDIYNNNNNAMLIRSTKLAQNYTAEFQELFSGQFGKSSPNTVPNPVITIDGTEIETFFESEGDAGSRLAELLSNAQTVQFMAFSFTNGLRWKEGGQEYSIMDLLVDRFSSGELGLMGIIETSGRQYIEPMFCAGVDVRQDGNPDVLHHKVFIIDESIVVMGSFNFSKNASENNDENLLIIHNADIAKLYLEEFNRRWAEAQAIQNSVFGC